MAAAQEIKARHPAFRSLSRTDFLREMREAALMVAFDEDGALEALPLLLRTEEERSDAIAVLRELIAWRPDVAPEVEAVLARVSAILGIDPDGPGGGRKSLPVPAPAIEAHVATVQAEVPAEAAPAEPVAAKEATPVDDASQPAKPARMRKAATATTRATTRAAARRSRAPHRSE